MTYYIIAGEASGDLHASNLIKELAKKDPAISVRAWGGDLMQKQGAHIVKHYKDLSFMGFVEVLLHIKTILQNFRFCKKDIIQFQPDALILVDYPGFNLRIAKWAKQKGLKVYYYISPQVWAWKKNRVYKIKKYIDKLFVILPFEKKFYTKYGVDVEFVGHPLLDAIQKKEKNNPALFRKKYNLPEKPFISILPGSRTQEIKKMLPIMLEASKAFPKHHFLIAQSSAQPDELYLELMKKHHIDKQNITLIKNDTYPTLQNSVAAMVTSGTATLETALLNIPQVVCYKVNPISYKIARWLVEVEFAALVNLILQKEIIKELIQNDLTPSNLVFHIKEILENKTHRNNILEAYQLVREKLGEGKASETTAKFIHNLTASI